MTPEEKAALMLKMEEAAKVARTELELAMGGGVVSGETIKAVGSWINKYYLKAGYKRLARILMAVSEAE